MPQFDFNFEPETYLKKETGYFSTLVQFGSTKQQISYPIVELPFVIKNLDPKRDSWISQAQFYCKTRRIIHLQSLGLCFVDLDTYRSEGLKDKNIPAQVAALLYFCEVEGIPIPSLIIFSGRGLQAKWLLENALPRQALPRWNAVQRHLVDALLDLGADTGAKDASRVLRCVDTVNTKSGKIAKIVHLTEGETKGKPIHYDFEYLTECVLPIARHEIEEGKKARLKLLKSKPKGKKTNLQKLNGRNLAWNRLEDLRSLVKMRGGVKEGERMRTLFWQLNFLLLSGATNHRDMWHEAAALAKEIDPNWGYRSKELSTLYQKAKEYSKGQKIEFAGREYPSLYTPKNQTLIDLFRITDDEQAQLKTIITLSMSKERHKVREKNRRRDSGAISREEYLKNAETKKEQAIRMKKEGLSLRKIALELGVSVGSIHGYLKCSKSVRITNGVASDK